MNSPYHNNKYKIPNYGGLQYHTYKIPTRISSPLYHNNQNYKRLTYGSSPLYYNNKNKILSTYRGLPYYNNKSTRRKIHKSPTHTKSLNRQYRMHGGLVSFQSDGWKSDRVRGNIAQDYSELEAEVLNKLGIIHENHGVISTLPQWWSGECVDGFNMSLYAALETFMRNNPTQNRTELIHNIVAIIHLRTLNGDTHSARYVRRIEDGLQMAREQQTTQLTRQENMMSEVIKEAMRKANVQKFVNILKDGVHDKLWEMGRGMSK